MPLRAVAPLALFIGAAVLWVVSLPAIDPDRMNDFGLVSVLPPAFAVAAGLLSLGFALVLVTNLRRRSYRRALLMAHVVLLALVLFGTPAFVEVVPRSATMWQHLGVADYVAVHGAVDRTIDAYFNWPGFFIGLAYIQGITGLSSLAGIAAWAPVFFNLAYALVLFALFRLSFRDDRPAWLGVWVFLCTNWVGQDILSPQAFGYFIYLNVLLLALAAFPAVKRRVRLAPLVRRARGPWASRERASALPAMTQRLGPTPLVERVRGAWASHAQEPLRYWRRSRAERLALVLVVVGLFSAVTISHQLTPYAIAFVISAFAIVNVTRLRAIPLLMLLMIFAWFTYSAVPFLDHFLARDTGFGEVRENLSASVAARVSGTKEHEMVVYSRLLLTGLFWGTAALSAAVRLWRGYRDTAFIVVATVPATLVIFQSYGGEIALRIYLFTLPAAAFFVAASLARAFGRWPAWRLVAAIMAINLVFLPLFALTRYGNERVDYFTQGEYKAVSALYRISPRGSTFFVLTPNLPWRWQRYADDETETLYQYVGTYQGRLRETPETIANTMADVDGPAFLILTRAQAPFATYLGGIAPEAVTRFQQLISESPRFVSIYSNPSAVIYRLAPERLAARKDVRVSTAGPRAHLTATRRLSGER